MKIWTIEEIKNLMATNDRVLYRALYTLYTYQTTAEQEYGQTIASNGVGFNGCDAEILTSFAKFLMRTGFLTEKQKVLARKKMVKYAKQLTKIANEQEAEKVARLEAEKEA